MAMVWVIPIIFFLFMRGHNRQKTFNFSHAAVLFEIFSIPELKTNRANSLWFDENNLNGLKSVETGFNAN